MTSVYAKNQWCNRYDVWDIKNLSISDSTKSNYEYRYNSQQNPMHAVEYFLTLVDISRRDDFYDTAIKRLKFAFYENEYVKVTKKFAHFAGWTYCKTTSSKIRLCDVYKVFHDYVHSNELADEFPFTFRPFVKVDYKLDKFLSKTIDRKTKRVVSLKDKEISYAEFISRLSRFAILECSVPTARKFTLITMRKFIALDFSTLSFKDCVVALVEIFDDALPNMSELLSVKDSVDALYRINKLSSCFYFNVVCGNEKFAKNPCYIFLKDYITSNQLKNIFMIKLGYENDLSYPENYVQIFARLVDDHVADGTLVFSDATEADRVETILKKIYSASFDASRDTDPKRLLYDRVFTFVSLKLVTDSDERNRYRQDWNLLSNEELYDLDDRAVKNVHRIPTSVLTDYVNEIRDLKIDSHTHDRSLPALYLKWNGRDPVDFYNFIVKTVNSCRVSKDDKIYENIFEESRNDGNIIFLFEAQNARSRVRYYSYYYVRRKIPK